MSSGARVLNDCYFFPATPPVVDPPTPAEALTAALALMAAKSRRTRLYLTLEMITRAQGATMAELVAAFHGEFGSGDLSTAHQAVRKLRFVHGISTVKGREPDRAGVVYRAVA